MATKKQSRVAEHVLRIPQATLASVHACRSKLKMVNEQASRLERELKAEEAEVVALLKNGAVIEPGQLTACVEQKTGQCRPSWKDLHIEHMAKHGVPAAQVEQSARDAFPPETKDVLAIGVVITAGRS